MPKQPEPRRAQPEPAATAWPAPGLTIAPWGWTIAAQRFNPVVSLALAAECGCPADCLRDHENE